MLPPEASRTLLRSMLGFFLLWTSVQGEHLEGTGSVKSLQRVDSDVILKNDSRIPDSLWVNEEGKTSGQLLDHYKTSLISCEEIGVFPLQGSCKEFYHCDTLKGLPLVLTCPQKTVFDTEKKTCIPSGLTVLPECKSNYNLRNSEGRRKRSVASASSCSNETTESLVKSSREACASTRDIDTYIANVKAVRSLELRSFDKEEYKAIIRNYNSDLSLSQSNYNEWRDGKSVFSAIKETFLAAKNFEPTFNTKYEETQKIVKKITNQDTPDIKQMEEDIEALKSEIKETQEVLSILEGSPSDDGPVDYLKNSLREKEHQLEQLVSSESRIKTEREIAALLDFLEMVRVSVVDIQQNAIETTSRVESFKQKIVTDSSIFLRHRETARNGMQLINLVRLENDLEKKQIAAEITNLQDRVQQENNEMSRIRNLISRTESELRDIEHRISSMESDARKRQEIGTWLFVIPVAGWIAGGVLLGTGIKDEKRLRNQRQDTINFYRNMLSVHQIQINSKARELFYAQNRISTLTIKSRELNEELLSFEKLDQDLAKLQNDINSILPSVNKALASVEKLKTVFDDIKQDLEDTLEVAKSRRKNAEEKNLLYFIYNGISDLKCKWNQANVKIIALNQCN